MLKTIYALITQREIAPNSNSWGGGITIQRNLSLNPRFQYLSLSLDI